MRGLVVTDCPPALKKFPQVSLIPSLLPQESVASSSCAGTSLGQSYSLGHPDVDAWTSSSSSGQDEVVPSVVANVFFHTDSCRFYPRYVEPQMVSSHVNLVSQGGYGCFGTSI